MVGPLGVIEVVAPLFAIGDVTGGHVATQTCFKCYSCLTRLGTASILTAWVCNAQFHEVVDLKTNH